MARFDVNDYIDVQERINRFWKENPDGAIRTELVSITPDHRDVVIHAAVYLHREDTLPVTTGLAQEMVGTKGPNETSWVENGETSAIGRAFANLGYATSGKCRPSKQEMEKVVRHAPGSAPAPKPPAPPTPIKTPTKASAPPAPLPPARAVTPPPGTVWDPLARAQKNFIVGLAETAGFVKDDGHHDAEALGLYAATVDGIRDTLTSVNQLSKTEAVLLIEELQAINQQEGASA